MSNKENTTTLNLGSPPFWLVTVVLLIAKLTGLITWPWWLVLSPMILSLLIAAVMLGMFALALSSVILLKLLGK